jgi:hypothetical protein
MSVWNFVSHNGEGETYPEGVRARVLGKIFGSKRDEITGYCRRLHNEELQDS